MADLDIGIPPEKLPRHIAVIMDGNGRWAKKRRLPRIKGHQEGIRSVREIVRNCRKIGIGYLTLFAFSLENWRRPEEEVSALFGLLKRYIHGDLKELKENGVRLTMIGRMERLAPDVRELVLHAIKETEANDKLVLTIALSYGSRDEIAEAARRIAQKAKSGELDPETIGEQTFPNHLFTADLPDPDLLIRTSGEFRISNFLLWQLAYAEIVVTDTLWPDFRREQLIEALREYAGRERRFGYTGDQIQQMEANKPRGGGDR